MKQRGLQTEKRVKVTILTGRKKEAQQLEKGKGEHSQAGGKRTVTIKENRDKRERELSRTGRGRRHLDKNKTTLKAEKFMCLRTFGFGSYVQSQFLDPYHSTLFFIFQCMKGDRA